MSVTSAHTYRVSRLAAKATYIRQQMSAAHQYGSIITIATAACNLASPSLTSRPAVMLHKFLILIKSFVHPLVLTWLLWGFRLYNTLKSLLERNVLPRVMRTSRLFYDGRIITCGRIIPIVRRVYKGGCFRGGNSERAAAEAEPVLRTLPLLCVNIS